MTTGADRQEIIVVVEGPAHKQEVADLIARRMEEEGIDLPVIVVDGSEPLPVRMAERDNEINRMTDVIEKIELKAEGPKAPDVFIERFRPAKDWEQRNRQRPVASGVIEEGDGMAYGNSYTHFFWTRIKDEKELGFQLKRCAEINFGDYGERGGGTTIAHIRWDLSEDRKAIVACRFEGIPNAVHTLTLERPLPVEGEDRPTDADVERIMAHWEGFTETIRKRHEADLATMFPHRKQESTETRP